MNDMLGGFNQFRSVESSNKSGQDGGGSRFLFYDMNKKSTNKKKKTKKVDAVKVKLSDAAKSYISAKEQPKNQDQESPDSEL